MHGVRRSMTNHGLREVGARDRGVRRDVVWVKENPYTVDKSLNDDRHMCVCVYV
jgi:hypothetical protein